MLTTPARFSLPQLDDIGVASPCTADWDQMSGDDRARHCAQCDKKVYNLSGMTRDEANRLIFDTEGAKCVRFFRREDGSILTADCPVGLAAVRLRVRAISRRAVAVVSMLVAGTVALATGRASWGSTSGWGNRLGTYEPFRGALRIAGKPAPQQRMTMGLVALPVPKPLPLVPAPQKAGTP